MTSARIAASLIVMVLAMVLAPAPVNRLPMPLGAAMRIGFGTAAAGTGVPTAVDTLANAEREFSARSVEAGMKTAFLAYLAPDGIIFRPGPVNGVKTWAARQNPSGTLIWEPEFVEVSGNGDLGLSTGPWEYRTPDRGDSAVAFGHFVSMWKREVGDPWRVALDCGVSHDRPAGGGYGAATLTPGAAHAPYDYDHGPHGLGFGVGVSGVGGALGVGATGTLSARDRRYREMAHANNEMMSTERTLTFTLQQKGLEAAYGSLAAEDLRFYREGHEPTVGVLPAIEALKGTPAPKAVTPLGNRVSTSYDLGYSYGLVTRMPKGSAAADTSAYLHVWRRGDDGKWKLALEVENPYPTRK